MEGDLWDAAVDHKLQNNLKHQNMIISERAPGEAGHIDASGFGSETVIQI